uniref:Sugar phosphate transporter domain-containing protein n=1 Tax=Octactis speculum TaxID=3111310 RepID=A0A7S2DMK3_9STRA|mmetsp:Transcript_51344/g.69938  ORF Transcript_51344/g.69938 Transcript_51344/m.69938 type:complete len:107 (+) Transcript_51344:39-359(+)
MAGKKEDGSMLSLVLYFAFWYLGNYYYNIYNKTALNETGGKTAGYAMTVSTMQLAVCTVYALTLWLIRINPITILGLLAPSKQVLTPRPSMLSTVVHFVEDSRCSP